MPAVMSLSEAAAITHGALRGSDCLFHGVAIDSRRTHRGDLFVAIPPAAGASGADGHDFIGQASAHGAVGALVSKAGLSGVGDAGVAQIKVADTTAALGQLGANWRRRFDRPLVAVTGSNGKTTVSALIAAIFNGGGRCLSPRASFNNQWGVPMTLLRLREHHTHIVIEMGMNQPGEIEALSALARPSVALINNAAPAHLAGLTDLRGIADAKAEIFSGLIPGGTAVLNADDEFYDHWRRRARGAGRVLSFGTRKAAGVVAADISVDPQSSAFELRIGGRGGRGGRGSPRDARRIRVRLPLPGRHNVLNATAAAAATTAVGIGLTQIKAGLESCVALDGRLRPLAGLNGALIIDDSYNANPASVKAALEVLAGFDGGRIAVFGVMAELGAQSDALHREVGRHAHRCGIQHLLCLGPKDSGAVAGYMDGFGKKAKCFDAPGPLLAHLVPMLEAGVTVLVKGSRAAAMERVAAELVAEAGAATAMTMPRGGALC